ncbi:MAG: PilZ domain-containing protein [Oligoflexia bacterium]|nr:PilZ domain-containing protein [Oligoflexia bacterium]
MTNSDGLQRRKFPRRQFRQSIGLLVKGGYHIVNGIEIGEGGMLIMSPQALTSSSHIVLNFFVPERSFVTVTGEVLYSNAKPGADGVSVGVRFINLPFEGKRMIRDYIAEKTSAEEEAV